METEYITFRIKLSDEELNKFIIGHNSILLLSRLMTNYNRMKESYLQDGYEIIEEDIKKFSFTAKKQLN